MGIFQLNISPLQVFLKIHLEINLSIKGKIWFCLISLVCLKLSLHYTVEEKKGDKHSQWLPT